MSLTVACVLWVGDDPTRKDHNGLYTEEWVALLRDGVARHNPEARFVCLSNADVPCERIPLQHGWPSVWSKIELHRPGQFKGNVLYLDLDTVVTGDLRACIRDDFAMQKDPIPANGPGCASAMAWKADTTALIYETMLADPAKAMRDYPRGRPKGKRCLRDQGFAQDIIPASEDWLPVASYKHDCKSGPPEWAAAVTFHGSPKMHQVTDDWVREIWALA